MTQTLRGIYPSLVQILASALSLSIPQKCDVWFKEDTHKMLFFEPTLADESFRGIMNNFGEVCTGEIGLVEP